MTERRKVLSKINGRSDHTVSWIDSFVDSKEMACHCCKDQGKTMNKRPAQALKSSRNSDALRMEEMACGCDGKTQNEVLSQEQASVTHPNGNISNQRDGDSRCGEECIGCLSTDDCLTSGCYFDDADESIAWDDRVGYCKSKEYAHRCCEVSRVEVKHRKEYNCQARVGGHGRLCQAVPKSCLKHDPNSTGSHELQTHDLPSLTMVDPQLRSKGLMAPPPSSAALLRRHVKALQCALKKRVESECQLKITNTHLQTRLDKCLLELDVDSVQSQLDTLNQEMQQTINLLRELADRNVELEKEKVDAEKRFTSELTKLQVENSALKNEKCALLARVQFQSQQIICLRNNFVARRCVPPCNVAPSVEAHSTRLTQGDGDDFAFIDRLNMQREAFGTDDSSSLDQDICPRRE